MSTTTSISRLLSVSACCDSGDGSPRSTPSTGNAASKQSHLLREYASRVGLAEQTSHRRALVDEQTDESAGSASASASARTSTNGPGHGVGAARATEARWCGLFIRPQTLLGLLPSSLQQLQRRGWIAPRQADPSPADGEIVRASRSVGRGSPT